MYRISLSGLILFSAATLLAVDAPWKTKPISQWNEADAKQVLVNSPWVKRVTPAVMPQQNEALKRQSGQMGGGTGAGLEAFKLPTFSGEAPKARNKFVPVL